MKKNLEELMKEATTIGALELSMYHACGYNVTCYTLGNADDVITKGNTKIVINQKNLTVNNKQCNNIKEIVDKTLELLTEEEKVKTIEYMKKWFKKEYDYIY